MISSWLLVVGVCQNQDLQDSAAFCSVDWRMRVWYSQRLCVFKMHNLTNLWRKVSPRAFRVDSCDVHHATTVNFGFNSRIHGGFTEMSLEP